MTSPHTPSATQHYNSPSPSRGRAGERVLFLLLPLFLASCDSPHDVVNLHRPAPIVPDYNGVTMPCNMALPTFALTDTAAALYDRIEITDSLGQDLRTYHVQCRRKDDGQWVAYNPINIYVSRDSIDPYLAYRLIEPGYEVWGQMGIYQRHLENYDETAILTNADTKEGCMNCHSFHQYNPDKMQLHLRKQYSGTYILQDGQVKQVTATPHAPYKTLVYPSWHPEGRYIAYSVNDTKQMFHSTDLNRIEVFDRASDVVVYDTERDKILSTPLLTNAAQFETFPHFSPDGQTLYFCSADTVPMPARYRDVHYSLCRIAFDPATGAFGSAVDTLYNAHQLGGTAVFPRVSPDGKQLIFTHADYGNFTIWHKEADLWCIDLQQVPAIDASSLALTKPQDFTLSYDSISSINSDDVDSYHSWSSNGRWLVFSSRRMDALYTRPFFAHYNDDGTFSKPFALPQQDPDYYTRLMKSFNIPEFIHGAVSIDKSKLLNPVHNP